ncbi:conserved hypothetical protein [Ricinus communis]|uniref:Reverse transcriptase zinc-binding domain-containing protein n=1 Tax=Ricinus communis TaxID=3988 RepID=B9T5B3_RICCO|nr:conserved hypothetical protein [Ricinus communis]
MLQNPDSLCSQRSICLAKGMLQDELCWRVGNGLYIRIWYPNGLIGENSKKPLVEGGLPDGARVRDLIDPVSGSWNRELIMSNFLPFEADAILRLPLSLRQPLDILFWPHSEDGSYYVKSRYHHVLFNKRFNADKSSSGQNPFGKMWSKDWFLNIPSKVKHFYWRLLNNILPCQTALFNRGGGRACISQQQSSWKPPNFNQVKIDIDAAIGEGSKTTGLGVVIGDSIDQVMLAAGKRIQECWDVEIAGLRLHCLVSVARDVRV